MLMASLSMPSLKQSFLIAILVSLSLISHLPSSKAYDPLDPNGNVTIIWDIISFTGDGYIANVRMYNYQYFRVIDSWKLTWNWTNNELIWAMTGAETEEMGDCSKVISPGGSVPHCCLKEPKIIDLDPEYAPSYKNCCKNGYLSPYGVDVGNSLASFQVTVGNDTDATNIYSGGPYTPYNFSLGVEGYTCTDPFKVNSTLYSVDGRRKQQVPMTFNVICTYSPVKSVNLPTCCVSLSAFYNSTIIPCNKCSCACGNYTDSDVCDASGNAYFPFLKGSSDSLSQARTKKDSIACTPDGCPITVHFHVKTNYKEYWRAKVTVINRQLSINYTSWNLVIMHPNFVNFTEAFSFNVKQVQPYGINNTAIFWGKPDYNDHLEIAGTTGNVQSEFLFAKVPEFTFTNGWAFPRRVLFGGEECVLPESFPTLPSAASHLSFSLVFFLLTTLSIVVIYLI